MGVWDTGRNTSTKRTPSGRPAMGPLEGVLEGSPAKVGIGCVALRTTSKSHLRHPMLTTRTRVADSRGVSLRPPPHRESLKRRGENRGSRPIGQYSVTSQPSTRADCPPCRRRYQQEIGGVRQARRPLEAGLLPSSPHQLNAFSLAAFLSFPSSILPQAWHVLLHVGPAQ